MNQRDLDALSKNVIEARAESLVLQSLCAMLVVDVVLLKSPDEPGAELERMVQRLDSLVAAFGRQPGGMGKVTAPIAAEVARRVRVVAETALKSVPDQAA